MKIISTLLFTCILMQLLNAQPLPNYLQTTTFGNVTAFADTDSGSGDPGSMNFMGGGGGGFGDSKIFSEYDSDGNICSAGVFLNTVDFDPGAGVNSYTATGNDGFIQKLSPEGNLMWVKVFSGPSGFGVTDIAVDANDFVYASVYFNGTLDFDPGVGVASLTSAGTFNNSALVKLDANGEFVWVKHFSNTTNELSGTIYLDPTTDNVFVTGVFSGTSDFDPGVGVVSVTSGGSWDGYMVLLNSNGDYLIHFSLGVTGYDSINQVLLDEDGNLYMLGTFAGTVDFDFSAGVSTQTSGLGQANTFISKYTSDGSLLWAKMLGGTFTTALRMCLDADQNLFYASSMTTGSVDVDPGPDVVTYSNINGGALVVKLTSDGSYLHHAGLTGGTHAISALKVYSNGSLYVQGYFNGVVDFDPGTGISEFTSGANQEFIWMLNSDLEYYNLFTRPNTWPTTIRLEGVKLIVTGVFTGNVDFDPTVDTDNQMSGDLYSFYISEFNFCQDPTFGSVDVSSCGNYTSPSGLVYSSSGIYSDTIPNAIGCDSIITINLTYIAPQIPDVQISTATNSICQGDYVEIAATNTNGGSNPGYMWHVNETIYDVGSVLSSAIISNLDEVYVVMTAYDGCLTQYSDTSNVIVFTVGNPGGTADVFIDVSPSNIVCSGDTVVFNATVFNPGNFPNYTWTINGQEVGENSLQFILTNPLDGDAVACTLQSSDLCLVSAADMSEAIVMDVTESMIPSITISGPGEICPGVEVVYTADLSGEGANPGVNWYLNGSEFPVSTGNEYTSSSLNDGDVIVCVLVNNEFCANPVFDVSNELIANVYSGGDPIIDVSASEYAICEGEEVTFIANYENGGDAPELQWYLSGSPVDGENGVTFVINDLTNEAPVQCSIISSLGCVTSGVVYSENSIVAVYPEAITSLTFEKCPDQTIFVGNNAYSEPGFYVDSLFTIHGCDSIVNITISNVDAPNLNVLANGNTLTSQQSGAAYQWLDCNNNFEPLSGANSQSFSPPVSGSYAVEVTINECSYTSECVDITIIGVEEQNLLDLVIYPNPASDFLYINSEAGIESVVIEDMSGKEVYAVHALNVFSPSVCVNQFASGMYVLRIHSQNGLQQNAVFVKD
ncbi:MAG: T9SS type A sorting domain-containing protein [Flavobacteriales bacterium]